MRFLWLALALVACGPRDIEFIDLPPADDGGRPEFGPTCINNSDCRMPMSVCEKASCGAASGRCKRKPFCDTHFAPVCGCDNVNYWNDCLRSRSSTVFARHFTS